MNIGTHFDDNNHIEFISTHTKIGIPHEKAPITMQKHIQELAKTSHGFVGSKRFTLVGRVGNDQSIIDLSLVVETL